MRARQSGLHVTSCISYAIQHEVLVRYSFDLFWTTLHEYVPYRSVRWHKLWGLDNLDFMWRVVSRMQLNIMCLFGTLLTYFEPLYMNIYLIGPSDGTVSHYVLGLEIYGPTSVWGNPTFLKIFSHFFFLHQYYTSKEYCRLSVEKNHYKHMWPNFKIEGGKKIL